VPLKLHCDRLLEHLRLFDRFQVTLHERANSLAHSLLTHLEGVTNLDLFDASQRIFARD